MTDQRVIEMLRPQVGKSFLDLPDFYEVQVKGKRRLWGCIDLGAS